MNILKTLTAGITGTTIMTLFSYIAGYKREKKFEEPVLLREFIRRSRLPFFRSRNKRIEQVEGWLLHYAVGFIFSTLFNRVWEKTTFPRDMPAGVVLGAASGLVGIAVWGLLFRLHSNPPEVDRREFYKHLLIAHIIFGVSAALGHREPDQ